MAEGGTSPPLETQRNEISSFIRNACLKKGETWYLLDQKWFKQWKTYVGYDNVNSESIGEETSHPGPIDNTSLFKTGGEREIKDTLMEDVDFCMMHEDAWNRLCQWYGMVDDQQAIPKKVVEYGMFVKHHKVEVYLVEFKLCENGEPENIISRKFSKADTIEHIEKEMRQLFNISDTKETRMWNKYSSNTYELMSNRENTVQDAGLYQGQVLIIEQQNDDGTWPRQARSTSSALTHTSNSDSRQYITPSNVIATRSYGSGGASYGGSNYSYDYQNGGTYNARPGLCGLSNLGNTCFMNAALQCMSNTPPLTEYFLDDRHWAELNTENPLGMHGEIAESYCELIKTMWSGRCSYMLPRNFKIVVGRFAPQFSGYQQQDCQELMAFLLDGLHEDLNRVKKKPYVELKDADGRLDEVVAQEAWDNYLKRSNSIIVDIFHGLLKSTVVCPECSKISVTFDPFCYLSLPLPLKKERNIELTLVFNDTNRRFLKLKVTVPKMGIVQDLCNAVSKLTGLASNQLVVADVYNHRFHKVFEVADSLSDILEKDIIGVYEGPFPLQEDSNCIFLPVYMREKKMKLPSNNYNSTPCQLFGQPLWVSLPKKCCNYDMVYYSILKRMSRYVTEPNPEDEWWIEESEHEKMNGETEMTNGEDSDGKEGSIEEMEDVENNTKDPPRLFTIQCVNSYGNVEVDQLKENDQQLKFTNKSYLAIDWHPKAREKFYNLEEAMEIEEHESTTLRLSQKKQMIQLSECLELFTTTEKLGADDPWYCPTCKKHQQATKKFDLWSLPQVLIIHLKRFSYNRYWRDKLDILVEFPVRGLNMAKYIINPCHGPALYDLIAVANHYGGMGGGHYTSYAKNKETNEWHYFDDSSVSPTNEDSVVCKAAYVLFYMKRDPDHRGRSPSLRQNASAALGAPPKRAPHSNADSSDEDMECN